MLQISNEYMSCEHEWNALENSFLTDWKKIINKTKKKEKETICNKKKTSSTTLTLHYTFLLPYFNWKHAHTSLGDTILILFRSHQILKRLFFHAQYYYGFSSSAFFGIPVYWRTFFLFWFHCFFQLHKYYTNNINKVYHHVFTCSVL